MTHHNFDSPQSALDVIAPFIDEYIKEEGPIDGVIVNIHIDMYKSYWAEVKFQMFREIEVYIVNDIGIYFTPVERDGHGDLI